MHIQTHILSGWCVGNLLPLNARERTLCMVAAAVPDVDGLGILISQDLYWDYHHKLGHCGAFGLIVSGLLAAFSTNRVCAFGTYLALFHLHLVLDYLGSGPGWPLFYWWPFSETQWLNARAWPFFSWQNIGTAFALVGWTVGIAFGKKRTPLERLMPSLDRKAVAWIERRRAGPAPRPSTAAPDGR